MPTMLVILAVAAAQLSAAQVAPIMPTASLIASTTTFVDVNPDDEGPIPGQPLPPQDPIIDCDPPPPSTCVSGHSGGRVNGLSAVPGDPNTYFAASEVGGLFKFDASMGAGGRWGHLDGHVPTRTWDVAAAAGGQTVYATSFYDGRVSSLAGIQVSEDGGTTWTHPAITPPAGCASSRAAQPSAFGIALRPGTAEALVGTNCGIARTTDGGSHWVQVDPTANGVGANNVWDVVALPGGQTYACGDDGLVSSPDGVQWDLPLNSNPPVADGSADGFCQLAVSPDEPGVVIAVFGDFGLQEIVVNGGGQSCGPSTPCAGYFEGVVTFGANGKAMAATWSSIPHPDTTHPNANIGPKRRMPIVVTNDRSTVDVGAGPQPGFDLWFGEGNLIRVPCVTGNVPRCSTSSADWSPQPEGTYTDNNGQNPIPSVHGDMGDVEFDPTLTVDACPTLISSDGGVYRQVKTTSDCHDDAEFTSANAGLHAFFLWGMAGANVPGDGEHLYFGTQDVGFFASDDGGADWDHMIGADVFDVVADPAQFVTTGEGAVLFGAPGSPTLTVAIPNTVWQAGMGTLFRFSDPIDLADGRYWILSRGFAGPPAVPRGLHVTANLSTFRSDVTANPTALQLGTWPPSAAVPCATQVAEISGGGAQPYVLAGNCDFLSADQLWTFDAALNAWRQIAVPAPGTGFSMFGVDPSNPQRLYASVVGGGNPFMVRSTDGGTNWVADRELTALMHGRGRFVPQPQNAGDGMVPLLQPTLVAFDPDDPDIVVAGGRESGVFLSSDAGRSWALVTDPFGTSGLPHLPRPFFAHFDHELSGVRVYIGSVGRGVWRIELADADLAITKADTPDPVPIGQQLTYTLKATNHGPDDAMNVTVTDTLPNGVALTAVTSSQGACAAIATTVACGLGSLTAGSSATITIQVVPSQPGTLIDTATINGPVVDPNPANNSVSETTDVVSLVGSAFGVLVSVKPPLLPPVGFGPAPIVTLPPGGGSFSTSLVSVNTGVVLRATALAVRTAGGLSDSNVFVNSSADVATVLIGGGLVAVQGVHSDCTASAQRLTGSTRLVRLVVAGVPVPVGGIAPNQTVLNIPGGRLVLNEITVSNGVITVNALHLRLNGGQLGTGDVIVAQSRCGLQR